MKMDLIDRRVMGMAFRFGNQFVNGKHIRAYFVRKVEMRDDMADICHAGVMMVVRMFVVVFMLMFMFMFMMMFVFVLMVMLMLMFMMMFMFMFMMMFMFMFMMMFVLMVMMMFVLMVMNVFFNRIGGKIHILADLFFSADRDPHMCTVDAAGIGSFRSDMDAGKSKPVHLFKKRIGIDQFGERRHQHIAGRAHPAFKIKCFHEETSFLYL